MDADKLAAEILADREAEAATPAYEAPECFWPVLIGLLFSMKMSNRTK